MRRFFLLSCVLGLAISGAAHAQAAATCEASADKDGIGEVIADYELDKTGQVTKLTATWAPEKKEGVGEESENFGRPSMMMDYRFATDGALSGPTSAIVMINRFQPPGGAKAPPLSTVTVKVTLAGAGVDPITWPGNTTGSDAAVAKVIRETSPKSIKAEILNKANGKLMASAEFDLSKMAEVQKLATKAKADGDRRVAAFAKLAADGKAGDTCPAK